MAGSRSQVNKAHKSRFASKSSRHVYRTSGSDKNRIAKPDHRNSVKGGRAARVQRSKMARDQKRVALLKERRAQGGSLSSPRVIVLFGLSSCVNLNLFSRDFLLLLSGGEADGTSNTVALPGCKLRATVYTAPYGDLLSCMELCKVADLVAFVVSSNSFIDGCEAGNPIDPFGTQCLSVFRTIGLPSTAVFIQDLPNDVKRKQDLKKTIISCLASELPEECKFYPADTKEELHKFMWLFKEQHLSTPHWRSQRSYLMCQQVDLEPYDNNPGQCTLLMSGYVRAHSLSVNQLVHVSGAGDFQLSKIDVLKDPFPINEKKDHNTMDSDDRIGVQVIHTLLPDPLSQEPLLVENAPDPLAGEQTWPTEAEIAEADANNNRHKSKKKKLPRGTSDYQAAWIVDDTDDEVSDDADGGDGMVLDEQQKDHATLEGSDYSDVDEGSYDMVEETEAGEEMDNDEKLTKEQIEAEIKKIKDANAEDEEFPDEVDTPLDVPAKNRFAKYRGLKSFRTSSWDPKESLPPEYARIFAFDNFTRTQKHVLAKLKDEGNINEHASVGSFVRLHIKNVPVDIASKVCVQSQKLPLVAYSLLQHESKMSVLHFSIKKHDSYEDPIKSKDTLIFHVGFRKFLARPVFSSDNINCDKHKMERFLHEGRFSVASVYAPICYPPLPLIVMRCAHGEAPTVVATGSLKSADPDRIVLKKIILTGYPQRVSKLKAIVRFMFHNPEDVRWFKPVDVWTKLGRRGRIKETVGTHGAMKCVFNGVIQQHDTVCMSLYKRAYPKWPERLYAV